MLSGFEIFTAIFLRFLPKTRLAKYDQWWPAIVHNWMTCLGRGKAHKWWAIVFSQSRDTGFREGGIFLPSANEVCEGDVFTGVCLSTGGGMCGTWHGLCMAGGHAWQGGCMCGRGRAWRGGICVWQGGGMCATADTTGYGQWAGGTHPTGMHSCQKMYSYSYPFICTSDTVLF